MEFSSITIQGNIISSEILNKIRNEDVKYQSASDFLLDKKTSVRDEIGIAWAAARAHYLAFKLRIDRLKEGDSGVSETRNSWMLPLLREFGYDVEKAQAFIHPESQKSYAISHQAGNLSAFPVHIMGIHDDLDTRREGVGPRLSPHGLVQEYLNNTEYTYAIVTNGRYLRLLRDATRLVRLSYLEFDLGKMMEEELYADFAVLFRLLHSSRMPKSNDHLEESYIEYYHQESLASGSRIREKLSEAVETSIKTLANGFLTHPANTELIQQVKSGSILAAEFYLYQLRLIYRFLFLIVTEERNLVYPDTKDEAVQRKRKIYYDFYSIERLRKMAARLHYVEGRKHDLWEGVKSTFTIYEKGFYGEKLAIKPLGSGLFSANALGILPVLKLSNENLLKVIRCLTLFENDDKQWSRVNYSDLDVEEFGSVYEGLLEYDAAFVDVNGSPRFTFIEGTGRSSSGSHYTPEELVKPLIKHSLDFIIADKLKEVDPEKALLSITVCDVACGSGHILLSAARRIAFELACIRETKRNGGKFRIEQPSPKFLRAAIRDVIKNCIYGVDKNPLAVELCKVALWLEAHNPGEPLNFLDHHIKCGDAIVGLANREELASGIPDEAFKALTYEEKEANFEVYDKKGNHRLSTLAAAFAKRNKQEREMRSQTTFDFEGSVQVKIENVWEEFKFFNDLPENAPDEIAAKEKAYTRLINSGAIQRLKLLADIVVDQFYIPKTINNKDKLVTDASYFKYLNGERPVPQVVLAEAINLSGIKIFHWFLEFPTVFQMGGFDCILGNPPFLGGQKLSGTYGNCFLEYVKCAYQPIGAVDLVTYFFRRIFNLLKPNGFQSLISTNTIAQGSAREGGLDVICSKNGVINHAVRSMRWPGQAAVEVSLITIHKGSWNRDVILDNNKVERITPYLDDSEVIGNPMPLKQNSGKSFQGSIVLGKGFVLTRDEAEGLIKKDPRNKDVLFPYLNGDDLNNDPEQKPSRWVINFFDWSEEKAKSYPDCFEIVERLVKPERQRWKRDNEGKEQAGIYALRKPLPQKWWIYGEKRPALYSTISKLDQVMVLTRVSKYVVVEMVNSKQVFMEKVVIKTFQSFSFFSVMQSSLYNEWSWKYSSTLGSGTINYSPSTCFETFPFPQTNSYHLLDEIGKSFYSLRKWIMKKTELGLTKIYNQFHNSQLKQLNSKEEFDDSQFDIEHGKESYFLRRHLNSFAVYNETVVVIKYLRNLQIKMDSLVLESYGWTDIQLKHGFYELDYLPENDRIRFTINTEARKEILKRLLELNQRVHQIEISAEIKLESNSEKKKKSKNDRSPMLF